jgi:hypothetical protein
MEEILTLAHFKEWLCSKSATTIVGHAGSPCNCPIATYLHEKGHARVMVHPNCIEEEGTVEKILPEPFCLFIYHLDRAFTGNVTANDALNVLAHHGLREESF